MFMNSKEPDCFSFYDVPKAIWYFLAEDRRKYIFFTFLLFVALFYDFVPPFLIGRITDFLTQFKSGGSLGFLYTYIIILAVSSGAIAIVRLGSKKVLGTVSINARYRAKVWGFERLLGFSLSWHQQENTGNKAQRIITGSESIRDWTRDVGNNIFPTITSVIGTMIACIYLNPWFSFFFLYYLGVLVSIEIYFDRRISKLSDKINKSIENASGTFVESTSNILAVKALGARKGMTSNVVAREEVAKQLSHKRLRLGNAKWMYFQIHNSMAWGIFILIVALGVIHGKITIGLVLTYSYYFNNLRTRSTEFVDNIQNMIERKSNLGRMMPFFWNDYGLHKGDKKFPAQWDSIAINNASFRYKDDLAINEMNLVVRRGEKIGIAGHSGSGKSTLIKLFLGLYHLEKGEICVGNTNLNEIKHDEVTTNVSVVLQETELFNLSLKENITMMREVDNDLFIKACTIANLNDIIRRLPDGIETIIGERGYSLSGGERQRVGIARAVCKNAPIILLDEATSALDSNTEQNVMDGLLGEYADGKTMLIVAHRISTLRNTDRIIVFEKGELAEQGTFESLTHDSLSRFGLMYSMQAAQ
jgi:ABC-type multidrug transport system fused ATPase/permease subunit